MKRVILAAALAATVLLSGCNSFQLGFEDILRPPKTMGNEAEIEQLISASAKAGYTLKYPKSGSFRSAIIMQDLDGDGTQEAIAFFRGKDAVTNVRMLVMSESSGEWKVSGDFSTETTDVDCVDFADIDGKNGKEIIVGYTTYTPNVNFLSCYTYQNGSTGSITAGQTYSVFCCGNLDSNQKEEIIALSLFNADTEARATLLEFNEEKSAIYPRSSVAMDPNIVKFRSTVFSELSDGFYGLVADGSSADEQLSTQVIFFNRELALLRNPLYREKEKNPTQRVSSVLSEDIDNDRKIEIPLVEKLPYSGAEGAKVVADKLSWYNFNTNGESLTLKKAMAANFSLNYALNIPESWDENSYTASINSDDNTMSFFEWRSGKLGSELFRIRAFTAAQWDLGKENEGYSLIYRDAKYAYSFMNLGNDSPLSLSDDKIKTSFTVLNTIGTGSE